MLYNEIAKSSSLGSSKINSYGIKLHRAKCFKFWDIASVVCEEAKKNGEDDVAG